MDSLHYSSEHQDAGKPGVKVLLLKSRIVGLDFGLESGIVRLDSGLNNLERLSEPENLQQVQDLVRLAARWEGTGKVRNFQIFLQQFGFSWMQCAETSGKFQMRRREQTWGSLLVQLYHWGSDPVLKK